MLGCEHRMASRCPRGSMKERAWGDHSCNAPTVCKTMYFLLLHQACVSPSPPSCVAPLREHTAPRLLKPSCTHSLPLCSCKDWCPMHRPRSRAIHAGPEREPWPAASPTNCSVRRAHLAHTLIAEWWSLVIVRLVHDLQVLEGVVVARAVRHGVWRHGGAIAGITFSRAVAKNT